MARLSVAFGTVQTEFLDRAQCFLQNLKSFPEGSTVERESLKRSENVVLPFQMDMHAYQWHETTSAGHTIPVQGRREIQWLRRPAKHDLIRPTSQDMATVTLGVYEALLALSSSELYNLKICSKRMTQLTHEAAA